VTFAKILTATALLLLWTQPLQSQDPGSADRQAAAAALALLEARGDLPEVWVTAPFEILAGDNFFQRFLEPLRGTRVEASRDPSIPIALFNCDDTRCLGTEEPIPLMVSRLESDERGVTMIVYRPWVSPGREPSVSFGIYDYRVRVEGLGTDQLSVRLLQAGAYTLRAPLPTDPRPSG
jgi:hypothetical protein